MVDVRDTLKVVKSIEAHPRRESRIRIMNRRGQGVWVSIRLDSVLRLYHSQNGDHLQARDLK